MRAVALSLLIAVSLASSACRDTRRAYVLLQSGDGITEKDRVMYRGIEIGRVSGITFVDQKVRLRLSLSRADAPIRTQDSVRIASGIFGNASVEIVPGMHSASLLADGGTLPAASRSDPRALPKHVLELLDRCGGKAAEALQDTVAR